MSRGGHNKGMRTPTLLARKQTEDRVRAGIAKLEAELTRQFGSNAVLDRGGLDLRALYLAIDERAAAYEPQPKLRE